MSLQHDDGKVFGMPLVTLQDFCMFPSTTLNMDIEKKRAINAAENAMLRERRWALFVTQKSEGTHDPERRDIYDVGTIAEVKQVMRMPNGVARIICEGRARGRIISLSPNRSYDMAQVMVLADKDIEKEEDDAKLLALTRLLSDALAEHSRLSGSAPPNIARMPILTAVDLTASGVITSIEDKQKILEITDAVQRVEALLAALNDKIAVLREQNEIQERLNENVAHNRREMILREQMRIIQGELGGGYDENDQLRMRVSESDMPEAARQKALKEISRLASMHPSSPETTVSRTYIDWLTDLPWTAETKDKTTISKAKKTLDADHYGLETVKERILEFIAVTALTGGVKGPILCFVGPPGVGKTSIARSVAKALGRKFVNMSLGGLRDEAEIRGHRRTYIGSMPGKIISLMKQAGTVNPVMLFDEIDKMASDFRGDPASAMLEVLDPEQNHAFSDHYLDTPYDLSKVLFLTTANSAESIPPPLLDRMEVIRLDGYTDIEKCQIAKRHLIPKQIKLNGLGNARITFKTDAIDEIIGRYTREAGVRSLEQKIASVCRKLAKQSLEESSAPKSITITKARIGELLGAKPFRVDRAESESAVGLATGLAYTSAGGDTLLIEASAVKGKGEVHLTGRLGDVMRESAMAALSFVRARAGELGLDEDFYSHTDIHIHVPEGATPKDGPSAGITLALAMASALSGRSVRMDVAMTGEITLRGRVMPIGGLKEKTLAAVRAGIKTVLYPEGNIREAKELPEQVIKALELLPVRTMDEVFERALIR